MDVWSSLPEQFPCFEKGERGEYSTVGKEGVQSNEGGGEYSAIYSKERCVQS